MRSSPGHGGRRCTAGNGRPQPGMNAGAAPGMGQMQDDPNGVPGKGKKKAKPPAKTPPAKTKPTRKKTPDPDDMQ